MDQQAALERLDLPAGSRDEEILRVYRARSSLLKDLILSSAKASEKEDYRSNLRFLIQCRDAALGTSGHGAGPGTPRSPDRVAGHPLIESLARMSPIELNRVGARAFLGLPANVAPTRIERAYSAHQRALIRRFARARSDEEMRSIRRARNKLRTIRNLAL